MSSGFITLSARRTFRTHNDACPDKAALTIAGFLSFSGLFYYRVKLWFLQKAWLCLVESKMIFVSFSFLSDLVCHADWLASSFVTPRLEDCFLFSFFCTAFH